MPKTLLYNAGIITMDASRRQYQPGAILIDSDRILSIGRAEDLLAAVEPATRLVDLSGRWILPGLINTHVHTSQQLGRGLADDVDLLTWLRKRVWPYESSLSEEDSHISALLCGLEQIHSGVTCFCEAGGQFVDGMGRAVSKLGLRAALVKSTMDSGEGLPAHWNETTEQALQSQVAILEKWHGQAEGRIRVWFGLRTIFNNTDSLILRSKELADSYGVGVHMHVAEVSEEIEYARASRGAATVTHLDRLGVLGPNFMAVHCVWMTPEEIEIFAARGVKVSHCPAAAMHVLGFAKIPEMIQAGVCVSLGTDGAPCNNHMTLIDEMWLASLIHKGRLLDPTSMPAQTILGMVTCEGARAMLWDDQIGSLQPGKKADLVVINPDSASMLPMHDPAANMVSALHSHNVESVMVDGKWLMLGGTVLTVNEPEILAEAKGRAAAVARRAGIHLPDRFQVIE